MGRLHPARSRSKKQSRPRITMEWVDYILLDPDLYVGSTESVTRTLWVYDEEKGVMFLRDINYVPGLYSIFNEILLNAANNKQRDEEMDEVKVEFDEEVISIFNTGHGVPVEVCPEKGVYWPEIMFGVIFQSGIAYGSKYKTTARGRGMGAKLTNIFSSRFVIEIADGKNLKKYEQEFLQNMKKKSKPIISGCKEGENWTKITFRPDFERFNMKHLDEDFKLLIKKRVVEVSGYLGKTVRVELNGYQIPIKSFEGYVALYPTAARYHEKINDQWEVCLSLSEGEFQQVSFVNGISTMKGGSHVDYVVDQTANHLTSLLNEKEKNLNIKVDDVRKHIRVFINALIESPAFESHTRETLTLNQSRFRSKCELHEFLENVKSKSSIVENLLSQVKKDGGDVCEEVDSEAELAGTVFSDQCTLVLVEGKSARSFLNTGFGVFGHKYYGAFSLRGKLPNIREDPDIDNYEFNSIIKMLGLQKDVIYNESTKKQLRYGHLMILTDQDYDGFHIKGLIINFIHFFWPSLLKIPFLVEFISPIIKATHQDGLVLHFYSMPEYKLWIESLKGNACGWTFNYHKGLATFSEAEASSFFKNFSMQKKDFVWTNDEDGEAIKLAFSKNSDARKEWLLQFKPDAFLDWNRKTTKYIDFVNKELLSFFVAKLQRSIPSMVDGLKLVQRKILFCSFKSNFVRRQKVSQFSSSVAEESVYNNAEGNVAGAIIRMAQNFVGSNNINLLQPDGHFGTRNMGGKDAANARYIFTQLSPITRYLFPKDDDCLLEYLNEQGKSIEPKWYLPVIPMILVNGCKGGIGAGWSSSVPNYNPREIIANLRRMLDGKEPEPMHPWYRGFKGTIKETPSKQAGVYTVTGIVEEVSEKCVRVKELPIRKWTENHRKMCLALSKKTDSFIEGISQYKHDTTAVGFEVSLSGKKRKRAKDMDLLKELKLTSTLSTNNMHLFDSNGVIKKYDSPEQILKEFFLLRLLFYQKRKDVMLEKLKEQALKWENHDLQKMIDDLTEATPELLWAKDLDALEKQLDELDKTQALLEEERNCKE